MFEKLKNKFRELNAKLNLVNAEVKNTKALIQMKNVLGDSKYIPFTDSSLAFSSLAVLFNDIVINQRKLIIEFGAGTSTILLAKLLQLNKIDGKIISIEHDEKWFNFIKGELQKNAVDDYVDLQLVELVPEQNFKENCVWYNKEVMHTILSKNGKVDCVLVDGPPAYKKEIEYSRFPSFPVLENYLNENCSFFLDDTNRNAEKNIVELWLKLNPSFTKININESFIGLFKGQYFNVNLPIAKL